MKKIGVLLFTLAIVLTLSACEQKEERAGSSSGAGMLDIKNEAQKNINDSVAKENEKINNTLNENNMNQDKATNGNGDNSELIKKYPFATIRTSLGDIKVKLSGSDAPMTVGNFLKLGQSGFYDGTKFHRVIKNFMIQGGDPNSKTDNQSTWGMGGPGYKFKDELKGTEKYIQGTLAMANSGPNTNGSQFFIVTASPSYPLPPSYTVFGQVISGMDVALKIQDVKTGQNDRPIEDVVIESIMPEEK